jgi:hypothetical protein
MLERQASCKASLIIAAVLGSLTSTFAQRGSSALDIARSDKSHSPTFGIILSPSDQSHLPPTLQVDCAAFPAALPVTASATLSFNTASLPNPVPISPSSSLPVQQYFDEAVRLAIKNSRQMTESYVTQLRSSHDAFVRRAQHERDVLQGRAGILRGGFRSNDDQDVGQRPRTVTRTRETTRDVAGPRSYGMEADRRFTGGGPRGFRTREGLGVSLPAPASFERRRLMLDVDLIPTDTSTQRPSPSNRKVTFLEPVVVRDGQQEGSDHDDNEEDAEGDCHHPLFYPTLHCF